MTQQYELLVIGGGSAGGTASEVAFEQGRRVLQIERDKLGGTCHNYGCDPTKALIHLAAQLHEARNTSDTGLSFGSPSVNWAKVQTYLHTLIDDMRGGIDSEARQKLQERGMGVVKGEARFVGPHEVVVGDTTYHAEKILIATGSSAIIPDIPGLHDAGFMTNREAIWLDELPRRLAIIGAGPIGIEFSQMFRRFGVEVTVVDQADQILPKDDSELSKALRQLLVDEGIRIELGSQLLQIERKGDDRHLHFKTGDGKTETVIVDAILVATGFKPVVEGLNLQAAGVEVRDGAIAVDKTLRTSVPHIWAAGDVLGQYQFTHVASTQGRLLARNIWSDHPTPFDDRIVPWTTYTAPELAHVGRTEEQLREAGEEYTVSKAEMKDVERAVVTQQTSGLVKLLVGRKGEILGGHILAAQAGEMIAPIALAMQAHLTVRDIANTILPYPTLTEAVRRAAQAAVEQS